MGFEEWFRLGLGIWFGLLAVSNTVEWRRRPDEDRHGTIAGLDALVAVHLISLVVHGGYA